MLRKQSSEMDPADWFYAAGERLKVADLTWASEGLTLTGIKLLQEAVERYLKGYLIAQGWSLTKTHDLAVLLQEAMKRNQAFGQYKTLVTELTKDIFAQHYPGGDWTDIGKNYGMLRQQTGQLISLIEQALPQFFPKPAPPSPPRSS